MIVIGDGTMTTGIETEIVATDIATEIVMMTNAGTATVMTEIAALFVTVTGMSALHERSVLAKSVLLVTRPERESEYRSEFRA